MLIVWNGITQFNRLFSNRDKDKEKEKSSSNRDKDKETRDKDKDRHKSSSSSKHKSSSSSSKHRDKDRHHKSGDRDRHRDKDRDKDRKDKVKDEQKDDKAEIKQEQFTVPDINDIEMKDEHNNVSQASSCDYSFSQFRPDESQFSIKAEADDYDEPNNCVIDDGDPLAEEDEDDVPIVIDKHFIFKRKDSNCCSFLGKT